MMSPVAYDHLSVPSRATSYTRLSCDPTSTNPSPAMAGEEMMGPPVWKTHQMVGLMTGSVNGERPRCVGPKRNIACAGSTAYCGSGSDAEDPSLTLPRGREAVAGQVQWPASQSRLSLQSWSLAQGTASTWAQASGARQRPAKQRRRRAGPRFTGRKRNVRMAQG